MVVSTAVGINVISAVIVVVAVVVVVVGTVVTGVVIGVTVNVVVVVGVVVDLNDIVIKVNVSAIRTVVVGDGSSLH